MATCILKWNPAISSYTTSRYLHDLNWFIQGGNQGNVFFDWNVWDHKKVKRGDTVYLLKVGNGPTGIVAKGKVTSKPYEGEDWSGKGRETFYVNFKLHYMIAPDCAPILTTQALQEAMPDFQWDGGHSGIMLPPDYEATLETLWSDFIHTSFGKRPATTDRTLYVYHRRRKAQSESEEAKPEDNNVRALGEALYRYYSDLQEQSQGYNRRLALGKPELMKTVAWLLEGIKDSPAAAMANLECAKMLPWTDYDFPRYLRAGVESLEALKAAGAKMALNADKMKDDLRQRQEYSERLREAREKAEDGILMEDLRPFIEGFDIINGKMGSFHDSEIVRAEVNSLDDYAILSFNMLNGAEARLTLRFDGMIDSRLSIDLDPFIHFGYFYSEFGRVYLVIEGIGEISANQVSVEEFKPLEE